MGYWNENRALEVYDRFENDDVPENEWGSLADTLDSNGLFEQAETVRLRMDGDMEDFDFGFDDSDLGFDDSGFDDFDFELEEF